MPHLFSNRQRLLGLFNDEQDGASQLAWEKINAILYNVGGVSFVVGSIFFFPVLGDYEDLGAWTFFAGSVLYFVVTGHDMAEVIRHWKSRASRDSVDIFEAVAAVTYVMGTLAFLLGSVFFLSAVGLFVAGAWLFIIGSALFALGACVNVLQITQAPSMKDLQLMNLTAISFIVGSVLFLVASVPYLWHLNSVGDRTTLFGFLAWQYVVGSVLFLLGGLFNYRRVGAA